MENKNYTASFEVAQSPEEVFNYINNVSKWWSMSAGEARSGQQSEFEGHSTNLNDEFIMSSGDRHYSKQKLTEVIPNKKIVWLVTESKLNWLEKNKSEWTNMKMIFEITVKGDKTLLCFTHDGLVPGQECYTMCTKAWDMFIKERLFNYISNGKAK